MAVYYNDNDPRTAWWLRELIRAGELPAGDVDERSIADVNSEDLRGYKQCHFFAGIGGWALALSLAEWPEENEVWTGSCPCQPFSSAGKGRGEKDPRHLWPQFRRLISEHHPSVVFGEQVASKAGRIWLSRVRLDLEALGYGVGGADLCAASLGAPHIRQRLWWVGYSSGARYTPYGSIQERQRVDTGGGSSRMANSERRPTERHGHQVAETQGTSEGPAYKRQRIRHDAWDGCVYILCADGKARGIEPGITPLVDGFPERMGLVRGYGNAIVPQLAAEFIGAYMDVRFT